MSRARNVCRRGRAFLQGGRLDYVKVGSGSEVGLAQFREFLDLKPAEKPFFLQLCSNDPHRPLNTHGQVKHDPAQIKLPAHYPDTQLVREDFARYYDEIAHFDVFFGDVMADLEKRGLAANTIVAFMGDNGCSQFRGKGTLFEFGIHVPLLVRWPGKVRNYAAMVALADRDVGRVMQKLKDLGIDDKTLVIFSSDNGPILFDGYYDRSVEDLNGQRDQSAKRIWKTIK